MISDEFETTTIFEAGKLKPKYLFKKSFILKNPKYSFKANIHFLKIQNIHSKKIFIFSKEAVSARATHNRRRRCKFSKKYLASQRLKFIFSSSELIMGAIFEKNISPDSIYVIPNFGKKYRKG